MHSRLPLFAGSALIVGAFAVITALAIGPEIRSSDLPEPSSYASALILSPSPAQRPGLDEDRVVPDAAPRSWGADWIGSLSSGDCRGIATGDRSWCDTNDCRGIATGDRSWCSTNDCRGVAAKDRSWCNTSLCRAWASGDRTWCDTNDCRGVVTRDRSWCSSAQCRAIATGDRSWCP